MQILKLPDSTTFKRMTGLSVRLIDTVASLLTNAGCRNAITTCVHRGSCIVIPRQILDGRTPWPMQEEYRRVQLSDPVNPSDWAQSQANVAYDARRYFAMNTVVEFRNQMQTIAETGATRADFELDSDAMPTLPEVCAQILYSLAHHGYAIKASERKLTLLLPPAVEYTSDGTEQD